MKRVLVVGAPRSGTTWVGKTLALTAGSTYVHEPDGTADPFAAKVKMNHAFTPALGVHDDLPGFAEIWTGAFAGGRRARTPRDLLARRLFVRGKAKQRRRDVGGSGGAGTPPWELRLARAVAVPLVADPAAQNVVVKSVHAGLALEWIANRFEPEVLIVRRHPYNVLASRIEMGFKPGLRQLQESGVFAVRAWDVEPATAGDPPLFQEAFHLGVVLLALDQALRRHTEWHAVSHESLCDDPHAGLGEAASRLGLTWTAECDAFVRDSNRAGTGYATNRVAEEQPERWRQRLSAQQVDVIDAALARLPEGVWSPFR